MLRSYTFIISPGLLFVYVLLWMLILPTKMVGSFPSETAGYGNFEKAGSALVEQLNEDVHEDPSNYQDGSDPFVPPGQSAALDYNESKDHPSNSLGFKNPLPMEITETLPFRAPSVAYLDFFRTQTKTIPGTEPKDPCSNDWKSLCCDPSTIEYDGEGYIKKVHRCTACTL